jgi:murein L,D-transpeptidase YcbB/YkuD
MRIRKSWLLLVCLLPLQVLASEYFQQLGWTSAESRLSGLLQYPEVVEQIYQENGEQLIWFDLQQGSNLEFQLELIQHAGFSPLMSRQLSYLQFYRKSNRWFEYDLLATDTLLLYLNYAEQAKLDGGEWYFEQKLDQPLTPSLESAIFATKRAVANQQLTELIEAYTPDTPDYQQLVDTYLHIVKHHKRDLPSYQQAGLIKQGDKLTDRELLLERLEVVDVDLTDVRRDVTYYDKSLKPAIMQFQRLHGLKEDGVIGPATLKWLNLPLDARLSTLALNAERVRYWPADRNTIILVNVPSYEMTYWHDGKTVFESKVVVGRKARPTPLMTTNLDTLILNPTWNVPWKIMVEDIIPKIQADPEYITQQNLEILPKWGSKERIDPQEIDWDNLNPSAFPYRMTQRSGNTNALGLYKFNTPNKRAIYLHDTPSKSLFNKPQRAFSSGCIRVENADVFATRLLEHQGLSGKKMKGASDKSNKKIPLRKRIPVHIIYQTAWFEEGKTHYREDIYRLDTFSYTKG